MCLFAINSLNRPARLQCGGATGFLPPPQPRQTSNSKCRRVLAQLHAAVLQELPIQELTLPRKAIQVNKFGQRSSSSSDQTSSSSSSQGSPRFLAGQHVQQGSTVEVHFRVQYGCQFGQHLSLIGSPQGWHVPAAVPMTWAQGDVWNVVLPVQVGSDFEYKYIVMAANGEVARWQEGTNNSLAVQHSGVFLEVTDSWGQNERSVREVGPRLALTSPQKAAGSPKAASRPAGITPAAAAAPAPIVPLSESLLTQPAGGAAGQAAAAAAASSARWPHSPPVTGSNSSTGRSGSSSTDQGVLESLQSQQLHHPTAAGPAAAAGPVMQPPWGAVHDQHSAAMYDHFGSAAAADEELLQYEDEEEDQHWPADMLQKAAAAAAASAAAAATSNAPATSYPSPAAAAAPPAAAATAAAGGSQARSAHSRSSNSQQQRAQAAPAALDLAQLLPMLQTELEAALAELQKHPEAAQEQAGLLSEGQAVLAALQQQQVDTAPAAHSSISSSRGSSSSRSPSSTLSSGDEIAAALLSDNCEEACFCMVDAICSCADWDMSCACESDPDEPCAVPDDNTNTLTPPPAAAAQPEFQPATSPVAPAVSATELPKLSTHSGNSSSRSEVGALSVSELALAAALAARTDPAALAAREAAFSDVQAALDKSSQLLLALSDPGHPLMLEADRKLATASRQLHAGALLG